jgi:transcriptional regulator with XRE-family HTH domain
VVDWAMPYARLVRQSSVHRMLIAIGDDVRCTRLAAGLSQERLAAVAGVAQSTISRIERGVAPGAGIERIARIMVALRVASLADFERADGLGSGRPP